MQHAGPMRNVVVSDFNTWRDAARGLLADNVAPHAVQWRGQGPQGDTQALPLFGNEEDAAPRTVDIRISRECLEVLRTAAMFRDDQRWALLYRVLWRWHGGDRSALSPADEDGMRLHAMVKAVRREIHKMHAFVRFRERPANVTDGPRFVAWFEPVHDILQAGSTYFFDRMGRETWLIATPGGIAQSDGRRLEFGPPAEQPPPADDAGEALWLTYYRSTFNPARVNARTMTQHMPVRYWKNLPEGQLIPGMVAEAAAGAQKVGQVDTVGERRGTAVRVTAERAMPVRTMPNSLDTCSRCSIGSHATQAVPGEGPATARIMIVGEQPGDQEDLAGKPFIGPAGQLLDRALAEAGLPRSEVYLTNAVKHFKWEPRGKRRLHKTPAQQEVDACRVWLEQERARIAPRLIVALGATALRSVLGRTDVSVAKLIGQAVEHEDAWVVPAWHPAYVLRLPEQAARDEAYAQLVEALRGASELAERGPDAM